MTQATPLLRIAGKVAARDLTRAVYSGLLDRDPDEGGADAYRYAFQHGGDLADIIKCIVSSTEFRERFMRQYAGDLLCAVYQGLLRRDPTAEELTVGMSSPADFAELLRTLGTSEEHWQAQFERKATGLAHELADRLQADMRGGSADPPVTVAGGAMDGMVRWLATATQTDEYGAALFRRRAASVVNDIYLALLNRAADPGGLAAYTVGLSTPADIGPVVKEIAGSEEHWRTLIRDHAEQLVGLSFQQLLNRDPSAQELAEKSGALSTAAALGELLKTLGTSEEHWIRQLEQRAPELADEIANRLERNEYDGEKVAPAAVPGSAVDRVVQRIAALTRSDGFGAALFRRHAATVVDDIHSGLLNRAADPKGLAVYMVELTTPADIGRIVKKIANSEEHWRTLIRDHAEQLVSLSFQQLLNRDPSAQEIAEKSGALSTVAALGELLKTLATSEEHWIRQLERKAPELADEIAGRLKLDAHQSEKAAPAAVPGSAVDRVVQRIAALTRSDGFGAALFRRHAATVVDDIYLGLLNRAADPEGLAVYTAELTTPAGIGPIVKKIANSEEHWRTLIRGHAEQLVSLSFQQLLNRDPSAQELAEKSGTLSTAAALGELLKKLGTSEEHWIRQLEQRAPELADEIANRLELNEYDVEKVAPAAIPASAVQRVVQRIAVLTQSDGFGAALFRRHAATVVDDIYLGLLNRAADPKGLAVYTAELTTPAGIGPIVKKIANSEEHWHTLIRGHAEQLVSLSFQKLLNRDPSAQEVAEKSGALSTVAALGELLKTLGTSEEHWIRQLERKAPELADEIAGGLKLDAHQSEKAAPAAVPGGAVERVVQRIAALTRSDEYAAALFRRHAATVVDDIYSGLLNRAADPKGLAVYTAELTTLAGIGPIVKKIANSDEHWRTLIRGHAEQLVGLSFQHLLNRDPSAQELAERSGALSTAADLGELLTTLGSSEEHWIAQLERRAAELADEVVSRLKLDVDHSEKGAPVAVRGSALDRVVQRIAVLTCSDEYAGALFHRHAAKVVDEVYLALLDRPADPEGLALYTEQLTTPAAIGSVVKNIADSEEYRRRLLHSHNSELVAAVYQCLLLRPATPEDLASHGGQSIIRVVEALAQSDELWHLQLRRRAPSLMTRVASALESGQLGDKEGPAQNEADAFTADLIARIRSIRESDRYFGGPIGDQREALINAVYQGLLNRPVDPAGVAAYRPGMQGPDDVRRMIEDIVASPEYRQQLKAKTFLGARPPIPAAAAISRGEELFRVRRSSSPLEVSRCVAHGERVGRAAPTILRESATKREPPDRKVLLFGAYGNGNMGDAYEAIALQKHLKDSWGMDDSQIFATSIFSSSDFPFPTAQKLPPATILDTQFVNQFNCLFIGSGGLISHPHAPLVDLEWIRQVETPVLLLAIGAYPGMIRQYRALLERAWMVSGRDQASLSALKDLREDALLIRDPILSAASLEELSALDAAWSSATLPRPDTGADVLWVLRYPTSRADSRFLAKVAKLIQEQKQGRHMVVGIEPERDQALEQFLPGKVQYLQSLSDLNPWLARAKVVVSMRYYGCIFAALAGKPSIGYSQPNIKHLYTDMLIPGFYEPEFAQLEAMICAPESIEPGSSTLKSLRRAFCSQLKAVRTQALIEDSQSHLLRPQEGLRIPNATSI